MVLENLISSSGLVLETHLSYDAFKARAREVLNETHAIAAIRPWALLPILPAHMVAALRSILSPFYKTQDFTVGVLRRELGMVRDETDRPEGRTGGELSQELSLIVGDKDNFFGAHSSAASIYHEAMCMVFRYRNVKMEDVRIALAAAVGSKLFCVRDGGREGAERLEPFQSSMRQYLERCYLQVEPVEKSRNVPSWAIDLYGSYLWGWITDSIPADPDIMSYFRRRVFLA